MNWMLRNSKGELDGSWTLTVLSWVVTSLCVVLSMVESVSLGSFSFNVKIPDETLLLGYLVTMTGNYAFRRNKKDQISSDETIEEMKNGVLPDGE